ncbi:MAG: dual specificity protein phosphatase family protein [Candidatus Hodarchaeota archaeon]
MTKKKTKTTDQSWTSADPIISRLFVGSFSAARDLDKLREYGITHIVNCTRELPIYHPGEFEYLHIKLTDNTTQNIISVFPEVINFIHQARISRGLVLVHCAFGSSRSGTMAVAYILALEGKELDETIRLVQKQRPKICPNPGFIAQLEYFRKMRRLLSDNGFLEPFSREELEKIAKDLRLYGPLPEIKHTSKNKGNLFNPP